MCRFIRVRLLLLVLPALAFLRVAALRAQVLIIANPTVTVGTLSRNDLRDAFSGVSSSVGGVHISPILLKGGPTHEEMLTLYMGKSDSAFRAGWRSLVFSGQGVMPKSLDSEARIVEYVAHTPGAIGYISRETPHEGVKTLTVR